MKTITQSFLKVSKLHKIYFQQFGSKDGTPIIFLHGGPGGKSEPKNLDYLPENQSFNAVLFDQRGCGESKPFGEIKENTTLDLIEDIKKLALHLKLEKFYLFGSSWGSTLALLFAQKYPKRVKGLVLKSVFLARRKDIEWLYSENGAARFFPDKYKRVEEYLKQKRLTWKKFIDFAYKLIKSKKIEEQKELVSIIYDVEYSLAKLDVPFHPLTKKDIDGNFLNTAKIYLHYLKNNFFLRENQILKEINKIKNIPTLIIHGRYDMLTPLEGAWKLHKALPKSRLFITNFSSHSLSWDGKVFLKEFLKKERLFK